MMPTMPFVDMTIADLHAYPDCSERAVLLAAVAVEKMTHDHLDFGETQLAIFQYLDTADRVAGSRAEFIPIRPKGDVSISEEIATLGRRLAGDPQAWAVLGRQPHVHLGVSLLHDATIISPRPTGVTRTSVRQVTGLLADNLPFRLRRIEGAQEPTISFARDQMIGTDERLYEALALLNEGFRTAHAGGPGH